MIDVVLKKCRCGISFVKKKKTCVFEVLEGKKKVF